MNEHGTQVERTGAETPEKNKTTLLAVYGTLRNGQGNWRHCLKDKSEYKGTFKTEPKYTMYGKGAGFPVVVTTGDTAIECDVFEVSEQRVLDRVNALEGCTGIPGDKNNWYDIQPIETPYGEAFMYVMHGERGSTPITTGNWLQQD